jgi:SAM-dependent methyltransferase
MEKKRAWFAEWFDSPYYHILYQNHNEQEAKAFLDLLVQKLTPQYPDLRPTSTVRVLDLACGKGRHSRYLASKGFDVTGVDLSENSIHFAQVFAQDNLNFYQHDMRKPFRINYFDYIFNIFTSFGYFDDDADNVRTLCSVATGLKPDGVFVLDYFNSTWVRQTIKPHYEQMAGGIHFDIHKRVKNGHIFKKIAFTTEGGQKRVFEEKVRLFSLADFENLFAQTPLKIVELFGSYQLEPFDEQTSNRLIIKAICH